MRWVYASTRTGWIRPQVATDSSMRVLYLTEEAISFEGTLVRGGAIHVRNVVAGLRDRGHDAFVIDWNDDPDRPFHRSVRPGERFVATPARTYRRAVAVGRRQGIDVIVSKTRKTYLAGFLAARRLGVPHLVHVGSSPEATGGLVDRVDKLPFEAWLRLPHDGYLVVCEYLAAQLRDRGIAGDRIGNVRNAVDTDRFHPPGDREPPSVELPDRVAARLPDDGPLVGYVGGLHDYKGVFDLAAAFPAATGTGDADGDGDATLVVAGDGPAREAFEAALGDAAVFLGAVEYERMPALYRAFDAFVLPSHTEGLPRVVLEAQATARPVVATDVGGVHEAVDDGETGLLCPARDPEALADRLGRLLGDADLRARLGAAGRRRVVDRFTWEALYDRYERFLSAAVDGDPIADATPGPGAGDGAVTDRTADVGHDVDADAGRGIDGPATGSGPGSAE